VRGKAYAQSDLPKGARNAFEAYFGLTYVRGECVLPMRQPNTERPSMAFGGITMIAPRWAFLIYRGSIAAGLYVCHSCDTPRCINPDHLWLGTPKQNSSDMSAKGRHWRTARMRRPTNN
jgi:hypothetical protein